MDEHGASASQRVSQKNDLTSEPRVRLLIVTGHFPPSGGVGARRVVQLCQYLARRGHGADVLTLPSDEIADVVPDTLNLVPQGTRVATAPLGPLPIVPGLRRVLLPLFPRAARGALQPAVAEVTRHANAPRVGPTIELRRSIITIAEEIRARRWIIRAERAASSLAGGVPYAAVLSSGPPHFAHLAAARLARNRRTPLIVDLRDPWAVRNDMPLETRCLLGVALARRAEETIVRQASLVVPNNPVARAALVARYPHVEDRFVTVLNGSDETPHPRPALDRPFRIAYGGSLYHGRNPVLLFRAVRAAMDRLRLTQADVHVEFAGDDRYEGGLLTELAAEAGLRASFSYAGRLGPGATKELFARSHMLVSLPQTAPLCVPAKLFEYTAYSAWLLLFAEAGSATQVVFQGTDARIVDAVGIEAATAQASEFIAECIQRHRAGESAAPLNVDGRFSRERQLDVLWRELQRIICVPVR